MFKILAKSKKTNARLGILETAHGKIKTPFFMPIATCGAVKTIGADEMKSLGADILLSNTYHLLLKPGMDVIRKARSTGSISSPRASSGQAGGLHNFMNWQGPILTDSGGFQVYSLGHLRKITEEGVVFKDPKSGTSYSLTPESAIQIQQTIGSDIMMCLDECIAHPSTYEETKASTERTTRWAARCASQKSKVKSQKLLFGIVQGGIYPDLRKQSALDLVKIGFDGYAIGGGETVTGADIMFKTLKYAIDYLPEDKPRYYMGVGYPEDIVKAVQMGADMFDCVIPTREARHGRLYTQLDLRKGKNGKLTVKYKLVNIVNACFAKDFTPIDKKCSCPACQNYTRAYIHHLFRINEVFGQRLASLHNLHFYLELMKQLRENI